MYTYVSAIALTNSFDGRYVPVDVLDVEFVSIFQQYVSVIVTLNRPGDQQEVSYNLDDLPPNLRFTQTTLAEWLTMNGNTPLPTSDPIEGFDYQYVKARNAWRIGCTLRPFNIHYHHETPLTDNMEKDVLVSKEGANYDNMNKWGLYSVNGLFYQHLKTDAGIAILDCLENMKHYNRTDVGFLDFSGIGPLTIQPIDASMISSQKNRPLKDGVVINLDEPIGQRKVLLCIGGYLHALDNAYRPISDYAIRFDFPNLAWANRYFMMSKVIDTSYLKVNQLANGGIRLDDLYADDVIINLFTHHQSFLVFIDTDDLRRGTVELNPTGISGIYTCKDKPDQPLLLGDGRIGEYHYRKDYGGYMVHCDNTWLPNWLYESTDYINQGVVAPIKDIHEPYRIAKAQLLTLSKVSQQE